MPKNFTTKKIPISFRLPSNTVEELKSIEKYHSKVDTYIKLGIDFEKFLNLLYKNSNTIMSDDYTEFEEGYYYIHRYFYKIFFNKDRYDDDVVKMFHVFYSIIFSELDRSKFELDYFKTKYPNEIDY